MNPDIPTIYMPSKEKLIEPKLYIMTLIARNEGTGQTEFYHTYTIAYSKEEGEMRIIQDMKTTAAQVYEKGQTMGGWKVLNCMFITDTDLTKRFQETVTREAAKGEEEAKRRKNDLMQAIITSKNLGLLKTASEEGRLTDIEKEYIIQRIKEVHQKP